MSGGSSRLPLTPSASRLCALHSLLPHYQFQSLQCGPHEDPLRHGLHLFKSALPLIQSTRQDIPSISQASGALNHRWTFPAVDHCSAGKLSSRLNRNEKVVLTVTLYFFQMQTRFFQVYVRISVNADTNFKLYRKFECLIRMR
ncbi:hypothetical protein CEXT_762961 [Caerostris extrusa]|uniref:Uncharacterized protein n=1 Tax=Caerostris extrusa TaxID=172846 RepID=A0AAV4PMI0_CAEEX|nr:hypothetical protein CEXT_762961 [Caerostris extrusa]